MSKKSYFICQNCGAQSFKWQGRCSQCQKWNTITEEVQKPQKRQSFTSNSPLISLDQKSSDQVKRFKTNIQELDRVLGGGLVPGGYVLLGGAPGIGKALFFYKCLKPSALLENSLCLLRRKCSQTSMRASRLGYRVNISFYEVV